MDRRVRRSLLLTLTLFGATASARAEVPAAPPAGEVGQPALATEPGGDTGQQATMLAPEETVAAPLAKKDPNAPVYGLGFRARWVTVPSWWVIGWVTEKNVPLSSYSWAVEGYRRVRDKDNPNRSWDFSVAVGYQNLSPPDGYWVGKNHSLEQDVDLVQTPGLSMITMDLAFISRQYFSRYFGIHFGAGAGLGIVMGKVLRTSATQVKGGYVVYAPGTSSNPICDTSGKCDEKRLAQYAQGTVQTTIDTPEDAHRWRETNVWPALPIINLLVGLDFPIPDAKGLEFRIEAGLYDTLFVGGAMGWVF